MSKQSAAEATGTTDDLIGGGAGRSPPRRRPQQPYKYLAVLDFEATCDKMRRVVPQEVIEVPVVLIDAEKRAVVDQFHRYVRPTRKPELTKFCTNLTGIDQDTVDSADTFPVVFNALLNWMEAKKLIDSTKSHAVNCTGGSQKSVLLVTCGDWDLRTMLPSECEMAGVLLPPVFREWLNITHGFKELYGGRVEGMVAMLKKLDIPLTGRIHSGIDDARNIASILLRMLNDGYVPKPTQ